MRTRPLIIALLLFAVASCIEKDPSWIITWGTQEPGTTDPSPEPEPRQNPDTTKEITPADVALLDAFRQDFKTTDTAPFSFALRQDWDDFRYFSGFPSLSENDTEILLLRLDPADKASECPRLTASAHTFYGSYSIRVKTPDLSRVRKTTDARFELRLGGEDPTAGTGEIGIGWKLSDPSKMIITSLCDTKASGNAKPVSVQIPEGNDFSAKFQTCGWDWTPDSVRFWVLDSRTGEKTVILEITDKGNIPALPGVLSIAVLHATDAPEYPFETEIDHISYEPYQEYIREWRDKYFGKK